MKLTDYLTPDLVKVPLAARDKNEAIVEIVSSRFFAIPRGIRAPRPQGDASPLRDSPNKATRAIQGRLREVKLRGAHHRGSVR
jgi:hypothetical protein